MKYVNKHGEVQTLIANRHPIKGVENYFTNTLLYQDQLKAGQELELPGSGTEGDADLESDDGCPWKLDHTVMDLENGALDYPTLDEGV